MSNPRKQYSDAQNVALLSQVSRVCPLCAEPLFYRKGRKSFKNYEIAHIYPLNPSQEEKLLLRQVDRSYDLEGRTVLPGLNDSHLHLLSLGSYLSMTNLMGSKSIAEVVERMKAGPKGKWIRGFGWNQDYFDEKRFPKSAQQVLRAVARFG